MTITRILAAASLAGLLLSGSAFAQTPPAAPAAPAATPMAPGKMAPATDKQAKSKECSMEANKQGLHGKARKTFRSKCKSGKM